MKLFIVLAACLAVANAGNPLVIDGVEAKRGEFPPLVSLQKYGRHFCGGTLINKRTVLTAAHCFFGNTGTFGLSVVAGITNLRDVLSSDRKSVGVSKVHVHPDYKNSYHYVEGDDIAVLKLSADAVSTDTIGYVRLAGKGEDIPPSGTNCQVVGWGAIDPPGQSAHNKKMVGAVKSITNDACARIFSKTRNNVKNVCAGGESSTNACRGDSGGPLFCNGKQVGVVSYGRVPCGQSGIPTVYARVATYRSWLDGLSK